ncbi:hypothetical protein Lepto7375DRAFT_3069 [Leptolyngbya sp. PCC 7375]|nr:hypothetical protein Lepto7375DRAFT_3069 [Leptolyngbya sp. PCC 7375]
MGHSYVLRLVYGINVFLRQVNKKNPIKTKKKSKTSINWANFRGKLSSTNAIHQGATCLRPVITGIGRLIVGVADPEYGSICKVLADCPFCRLIHPLNQQRLIVHKLWTC